MTAYDPSEWSDLFVAVAGAGAALAGLLFVAVSINVERIIKYEGLPERALESLILLIVVVVVSIFCLIPGQSHVALGAELLAAALLASLGTFRLPTVYTGPDTPPRAWEATRWAVRLAAIVPLLVGAIAVLAEAGGGLYWIVAAVVFAIVGAVANAWVLLVEILR